MGLNIAQVVASSNPIAGLVIGTVRAVINKSNDGVSNDSVITVIKEMSLSKWNDLTPNKIIRIIAIIKETPQQELDYEKKMLQLANNDDVQNGNV